MNKTRRANISAKLQIISDAKDELENIRDEEQDYYDNMPESLQSGEKGEAAQETIDQLQIAVDDIDGALAALENIE